MATRQTGQTRSETTKDDQRHAPPVTTEFHPGDLRHYHRSDRGTECTHDSVLVGPNVLSSTLIPETEKMGDEGAGTAS